MSLGYLIFKFPPSLNGTLNTKMRIIVDLAHLFLSTLTYVDIIFQEAAGRINNETFDVERAHVVDVHAICSKTAIDLSKPPSQSLK